MTRRPPAAAELAAAVEALRGAARPLVIAGGGVHYSEARAELAELSDALRHARSPRRPPARARCRGGELALGGIGVTGTRAANALAREADLVLCVGTRLIDFTTGSHSLFQHPDVRFVGLNVVARDAHKLGALPLVADAKLGLRALTEALGRLAAAPRSGRRERSPSASGGSASSPRTCGPRGRSDDQGAGCCARSTSRRARATGWSWRPARRTSTSTSSGTRSAASAA